MHADEEVLLAHAKQDKRLAGIDVESAGSVEEILQRIDQVEDPPQPLQQVRKHLTTTPYQRLLNQLVNCYHRSSISAITISYQGSYP